MKQLFKRLAVITLALSLGCLFAVGYYSSALPDTYYISDGSDDVFTNDFGVEAVLADSDSDNSVTFKLYGLIPIKSASLVKTDSRLLIPGGEPIGIRLYTDGVMIVDTQDVGKASPAEEAGLRSGDNVTHINGEKIISSDDFSRIIKASKGGELKLRFLRDSKELETSLKPICDSDGIYKAGLSIRDSQAGIGTLTFVDPESKTYGALGHPISDFDTHKTMPLGSGEIVSASIVSFERGLCGEPGELCGRFDSSSSCGSISKNTEAGIFGELNSPLSSSQAIPIGYKTEVKEGKAEILTTVSGQKPKSYDIEIIKLNLSRSQNTKNIVIKVTDPELLDLTGGILHGMSGSPIIQNGRLIGAVTHVFVNDPTKGYGIFIEDMLEAAK